MYFNLSRVSDTFCLVALSLMIQLILVVTFVSAGVGLKSDKYSSSCDCSKNNITNAAIPPPNDNQIIKSNMNICMNVGEFFDTLCNEISGGLRTNLRLQSVPHHLCLMQARTHGEQMPRVQVTKMVVFSYAPSLLD